MKTDDFVSYDLAQRLKEVEFKEHCKNAYLKIGRKVKLLYWGTAAKLANDMGGEYVSAPTLWHAQKWLREEKNIIVDVSPDWDSEDYCLSDYLTGEWYFSVWKDGDRVHCNFDPNAEEERIWIFEKYEQALSAGIAAALELIEQENK